MKRRRNGLSFSRRKKNSLSLRFLSWEPKYIVSFRHACDVQCWKRTGLPEIKSLQVGRVHRLLKSFDGSQGMSRQNFGDNSFKKPWNVKTLSLWHWVRKESAEPLKQCLPVLVEWSEDLVAASFNRIVRRCSTRDLDHSKVLGFVSFVMDIVLSHNDA